MARVWDETLLQLIREVIPAPTVHARNLFHTSAAMWDAWAAYDPDADGYFVTEKQTADDVTAAREAAISYAAYRLLLWRYATVSDLESAPGELEAVMASLCYRTDYESTDGDDPAALGNRIAEAVIAYGSTDGALEDDRYVDSSYRPANDPMVVADPGTVMSDPNAWQPLSLGDRSRRTACRSRARSRRSSAPQWGFVTPFALTPSPTGTPIDPGPPPRLGDPATDDEFKQAAARRPPVQLTNSTRPTAWRSTRAGIARQQHARDERRDRARREPGHRRAVRRRDGAAGRLPPGDRRVLGRRAEVGDASGPLESDRQQRRRTPPASSGGSRDRVPIVDPLEWDVKTYLALNGASHDAAIAAWGLKALLRLGAADLHDPLHGRPGSVERSGRAVVRP